jgi:hypothetical protein
MTDSNNINKDEILRDHSTLIHRVVMHCNKPGSVADLEQILQLAEENDWNKLVATIRNIMSGNRERALLHDLDQEENIIIESILNGLEDPGTLPTATADLNSALAAPGIASLIHSSIQGDSASLNIISNLTKQMQDSGGDYSNIAEGIKTMIDGERDLAKLTADISEREQKLLAEILTELTAMEA